MNKIILIGRLTRDPEIRYSTNDNNTAIARYTLAVNRPFRKNGEQQADFLPCIAFGKTACGEIPCKRNARGRRGTHPDWQLYQPGRAENLYDGRCGGTAGVSGEEG